MNESNKDALIESLKRKVKKLEDDNKQLREQLKVVRRYIYKVIVLVEKGALPVRLFIQQTGAFVK